METPQNDNKDDRQAPNSSAVGWTGMIQQQYRNTKENAETYPYVWGSYIVVYGGFGLWFAYRFWKLRKTEDRVRVKLDRLRKLFESQESTSSGAAAAAAAAAVPKAPRPPAGDNSPK